MTSRIEGAVLRDALGGPGVQLEVGPFLARIRSEAEGVAHYLEHLYPGFPIRPVPEGHFDIAVVAGGGTHRFVRRQAVLFVNGARPFLPLSESLAGPVMEWGLNWSIGQHVHWFVTVHSAVLERNGRALILPAPSGSGKSTLCAALAFSGWRFFSDEFALIDPKTYQLVPSPRPLSLKERAIDILSKRYPSMVFGPEGRDVEKVRFAHARPPEESVRRVHERAEPGWIVLPRYLPQARTRFEPLPKARAFIELADQSFNYNYLGAAGYECLAEVVRRSDCYRLEYSDLDDVLERLARLTSS